jgi:hypothetical protein
MFFRKFRQLTTKKTAAGQVRRARKDCCVGGSFRPRLEPLEDRCLLSTTGIIWSSEFGPPNSRTFVDSVTLHATDVYMAGATEGALPGQTTAGNRDAFVRKYDSSGNVLWTQEFGTTEIDEANGISVNDSGVYVVGDTAGTLPGQTSEGVNSSVFVRKYDFDGNVIWTRQFGAADGALGGAILADATGVYVGGQGSGLLPGQTGLAFVRKYDADGNVLWTRQFGTGTYGAGVRSFVVDSSGVYAAGFDVPDAFVVKYDGDGDLLWSREFGSGLNTGASSVAVDASGVYVGGLTNGALPGQTNAGDYDAFLRKYDADGNELWTREFGTAGFDDIGKVVVTATGVCVAGDVSGALPGQTSEGDFDVYVRMYDTNGNDQWTRQFGTSSIDLMAGLAADSSGIYVGGDTGGALPGQTNAGGLDAFLVKIAYPPTDISLSSSSVAEGQPANTVVGDFSTADATAGDSPSYTLVSGTGSDDNASFQIVGNQLETNAPFDLATKSSYTIRVRSTDAGGLSIEKVFTITVADAPLSDISVPVINAAEGIGFTAKVASFTDANPLAATTDYTATIDWGGGSSSPGTVVANGAGGFDVMGTYTYAEEGTQTISVAIHDNEGSSTTGSTTATIADAALSGSPVAVSPIAGAPFSGVVASFTDADPKGTAGDYSATISWGNGKTSSGTIAPNGLGGFTVSGDMTYATVGTYTVHVTIQDAGGAMTTVDSTANVTLLGIGVQNGEGAGVGYWKNKGQALIKNFNGSSASTALSTWLATMFPELYGVNAASNNLTGFTNDQVAAFYLNLAGQTSAKLDTAVLATALNVYATTASLGGAQAQAYGFDVTADGLGASSYNVGANGSAFGVANNSTLTVFALLVDVDSLAVNGVLYNGDKTLRNEAMSVFGVIDSLGGI